MAENYNPRNLMKIHVMQKQEGFENLDDLIDESTMEDIKQEISNCAVNIKELVNYNELTNEQKRCLEITRSFSEEASIEFKEMFLSLLSKYRDEKKIISPLIIDYIKKKSFDLPQFAISHGKKAKKILEQSDFYGDNIMDEESLLLIFQLPKPLAHFWWKGGIESWGSQGADVGEKIIEWGYFYRELMQLIWEKQGYYEDEKDLNFQRINDVGQHDPKKYYYIWKINER